MKDYYKINEIAKLYNLCADTLRYYEEQKILKPKRDTNNYRLYSIQDICTLNIVRNLRDLSIPLEEIRAYLLQRTVASTLGLLQEEEAIINRRIAQLRKLRSGVRKRAEKLGQAAGVRDGEFALLSLPHRPCFRLTGEIFLEGEIDFFLKKLEKRHEDYLHIIGDHLMGAMLNRSSLQKGIFNHYSQVFFLGGSVSHSDGILPGGDYASTFYRGSYDQLPQVLSSLTAWIGSHGYRPDGDPMELYHIETHDTGRTEEYLTEVQIKVTNAQNR